MNKEAKIGLTIILVLLIAFVAVVAKRLYTSHADWLALAREDKGAEKVDQPAETAKETAKKVEKVISTIASASQPTVVAAANVSGKPPQGTANEEDQLSTATDFGRVKTTAGSEPDTPTAPSYMPEPPKPDIEIRHDRYEASAEKDSTDYRNNFSRNLSGTSVPRAGRTYTVAEGDSLFDIARCELGKASRWVEIYDLNADTLGKDIDHLMPGTQIVLPDDNARK